MYALLKSEGSQVKSLGMLFLVCSMTLEGNEVTYLYFAHL